VPKESISVQELHENVINSLNSGSLEFHSIANYDLNQQVSNNLRGDLGFSKCITIPTTCSALLTTAYVIDEKYWVMQVEDFFFILAHDLDQDEIKIPLEKS
jgi:hypothetical protein